MAANNEAPAKQGGSGGGELEKRVAAVEMRLGVIEKTMVTTEVFQRDIGTVRGEIGASRDEVHVGLAGVRQESHDGLAAVRQELHDGFAAVRHEMHDGLAAVRHEMHDGLAAVRHEMHDGLAAARQQMHIEFGAVHVEIAKVPFEIVKWLIALSGIAAAIATTVYNIWFR